VPFIAAAGELKTKPTQHSVKALLEIGIKPDIIVCRTDRPLSQDVKKKIGLFCNVREKRVITAEDQRTIYNLPLALHAEGLDDQAVEALRIWAKKPDLSEWERVVHQTMRPSEDVKIAIVGKYTDLVESYKSLNEALKHGGVANECKVDLDYIDSERFEDNPGALRDVLGDADGILVPGGFGHRGIEGKIAAVRHARESRIPFFGICLGMQCAVIEIARNLADCPRANSTEFDADSPHPVIHLMEAQRGVADKGATMRLGAYDCTLQPDSLAFAAYGKRLISERHRHRYELNNTYRERLAAAGLVATGVNTALDLVEITELRGHPWFVGVQFHPEYKSRPLAPHPLFAAFVRAAREKKLAHSR
jgi:CTP synthase